MSNPVFAELRRYAYEHPLTRATGAVLPYFRQLDSNVAVGLTLNK